MTLDYDPRRMALEMMRTALSILDNLGENAAAQLQHAISIVTGEPRPTAEEDVDAVIGGD